MTCPLTLKDSPLEPVGWLRLMAVAGGRKVFIGEYDLGEGSGKPDWWKEPTREMLDAQSQGNYPIYLTISYQWEGSEVHWRGPS